jgi:hypothetical protein
MEKALRFLRSVRLGFVVVNGLLFGQHPLMQDTRNQNPAARIFPIENDMPALLHAPQSRTDFIASPPAPWIVGKLLAAIFKLAEVTLGLGFSPNTKGIKADVVQVGLGPA